MQGSSQSCHHLPFYTPIVWGGMHSKHTIFVASSLCLPPSYFSVPACAPSPAWNAGILPTPPHSPLAWSVPSICQDTPPTLHVPWRLIQSGLFQHHTHTFRTAWIGLLIYSSHWTTGLSWSKNHVLDPLQETEVSHTARSDYISDEWVDGWCTKSAILYHS